MAYSRRPKKALFKVIQNQVAGLTDEMPELPINECIKIVTHGHFSSIAFIVNVALKEGIKKLYATTLRIGKKELGAMVALHNQGALDYAYFVIGNLMATDSGKQYDYYSMMIDECNRYGWEFVVAKNHSKLILMETHAGNKYVLETSSNLNENPKIEQFSFERDDALFEYYKEFMLSIGGV